MLLKILGEFGASSPLLRAVCISAPMQLDICSKRIDKGFSKIYQAHLMKELKESLLQKYRRDVLQPLINIDEKKIKNLRSFLEFDEAYTAPAHGFTSAQDYYTKASSRQYIKNIQTPTLIIHALDDPFMTPEVLPAHEECPKDVTLELHQYGGHVGFIGGTFLRPRFYLQERILEFFKNSL
jgi:hypothetical protein